MLTRPFSLAVLLVALPALVLAEEPPPPPQLTVAASVQERARVEGLPDWTFSGTPGVRVGNRARAGLRLGLGPVSGFVQVQDVRFWGTEVTAAGGEGTLDDFSAGGFDLHQGYGQIDAPHGLMLRVGRQEVNWHGQRLIGAVGWTHQARSFDAVRLVLDREDASAELLYALILDRPAGDGDSASALEDRHLIGFRAGPRMGKTLILDGLGIVHVDRGRSEAFATVGVYGSGAAGIFSWELEGYGQLGTRAAVDLVAAGLFGGRARVTAPVAAGLTLGGGFDLVSGDDDPTDGVFTTFDTLYATNHTFYGHMDRYLNLPLHAGGAGLVDGMLLFAVAPVRLVKISVDVHVFASPWASESFHGVEVDSAVVVKPVTPLALAAGVWVYVPGAWHGPAASTAPVVAGYLSADFSLK